MNRLTSPGELCDALGIPFSDEQLAAITAPLEPAVIIAGAGTGKTAVMSARVVWLVGTGAVRPEEVLGLTFTRKAAAELGARVAAGLAAAGVRAGDEGEGVEQVMTYDSFAARLVAEFGIRLGIDHDPVMLTGAARFRLAARAVQAARGPFQSISRLSHRSIPERVLALDSQLQSHLVSTDLVASASTYAARQFERAPLSKLRKPYKAVLDAVATQDERLELLGLVEDYQALKAQLGLVEYADQLRRAVQLAEELPDVARTLRGRYRVVLLDEYQDTSAAQARLLRALFSGTEPGDGRGFPVTAVGDPRQAIYGWRGAASDNIEEFHRLFPRRDGSDARRQSLSINRRSGQRILDVGNALAADLPHADDQTPLVAPEGVPPGRIEVATFDTREDEFEWLADTLVAEHVGGTPWPDIAVLVRRNKTLGEVFEFLRDRDIPAEIVGLGGLLHLPEIVPVVATLRALDDVASNPEVAALLTGTRWQLGLADLEALGRRAATLAPRPDRVAHADLASQLEATLTGSDPGEVVSLLDAIATLDQDGPRPEHGVSAEGVSRLRAFAAELTDLRQYVREPVADLVRRVIARLGLEVELRSSAGGDPSQLSRFVSAVSDYVDVDGEGSLAGLLAWLEAEDDHGVGLEQAVPSDADSVKLLTVHRAKGLEWGTVFLPTLGDGIFPATPSASIWPSSAALMPASLRGDAQGIPQLGEYSEDGIKKYKEATREEHRHSEDRLAYVAVTRARQRLFASRHVWTPGNKRPITASPYFQTIAAAADAQLGDGAASEQNPRPSREAVAEWPVVLDEAATQGRQAAADWVREARSLLRRGTGRDELDAWVWQSGTTGLDEQLLMAEWDEDAAVLVDQHRRRGAREVQLPEGLSATALMAMRRDPEGFAVDLLRPMPRRPSAAATLGTRFHEWVQRRFSLQGAFDELDAHPVPDGDALTRLVRAFEGGQFADRQPLAVEVPFVLRWAGSVLRGRIDAVYEWDGDRFDHVVVDWKTSNQPADPLQLAVYRQAWAEARGLDPGRVGAGFHHILADQFALVDAPVSLIDEAFGVVR